jgi:rSAM/selenodomain-associated transferase 2
LPELAVIIPALNEAQALPRLLAQLCEQQGISLKIVVADGGSTDGTAEAARSAGSTVVTTPRGRGAQMNAGARATAEEFLLFLHADSELTQPRLLADALAALRRANSDAANVAGHFPLRFSGTSPRHAQFYRHIEGKTRLNRPCTINGDQGLLISRAFFDQLGSFDESLPFLEDQRIAAKIFAQGRWIVLPGELVTSARRFEVEGHTQRYTLMALIMGLHAGGADEFLARVPMYASHSETGRLDLRPFHAAIEKYLRELGLVERWKLLLRIGRFVRENTWQLFYRRDVLRGDEDYPCLRFHDRVVEPLIKNVFFNTLAALLTRAWFLFVLPWTVRAFND